MNERNLDKIPHHCLLKIQSVYDNLKTAERKAVGYILEHPEEMAGITIVDFASRADCSEATAVRLARRLGYRGFPELKTDFAQMDGADEGIREGFDYVGISGRDTPPVVLKKVFETTIGALRDTQSVLDHEQYERALDALAAAPTVLFCGVGDAALVAMEAHQRFVRIGQHSLVSEDPDLQLIMASHLRKGDVLVAVSHSGRSRTVVNTAKRARQAGATVIAITNFPVSPLTKNSDRVLLTAVFSRHVTGEVMSKRVAELCIIESLYINYLIRKGKACLERLAVSNEAVKVNKLE